MPDIAKCTGEGCPKKESCYRFTSKPSMRQSYFVKPPIEENGECKSYWEVNAPTRKSSKEFYDSLKNAVGAGKSV
jgi:hypothetical protein